MKNPFHKLLRYGICGLRAPLILLFQWKQVQKNADGFCLGPGRKILPWFTYPFIEYLENLSLADTEVFEFGSGSSSFFWLERGASKVVSVEHDPEWIRQMQEKTHPPLELVPQPVASLYPGEIKKRDKFDIILIDGIERMKCAQNAISHLRPGGIIILDNAEWYGNTAAMLRRNGFAQIDFCGFTPLNSFTEMTSIFFREKPRFPHLERAVGWIPVGGKGLPSPPPDDQESPGKDG